MKFISDDTIKSLNITPSTCVDWVRESFLMKDRACLPPKISLHPQDSDFINTMPCLLPPEYHRFGCKIVSRIKGAHPALKSSLLLIDSLTGEEIALMECDWITAMRTGAVAALAIETFKVCSASVYSFIGLGVIGHATLECFLAISGDRNLTIRLKKYKDHAEKVISEFSSRFPNVRFEISDTMDDLVRDADVIVSCITDAQGYLVDNLQLLKPGVLIVPVHTRGFQNCDTVFDKVFGDDTNHVRDFKYFNQFRKFGEIGEVLKHTISGRENDTERILSYNIGLGLHDVLFATKIADILLS